MQVSILQRRSETFGKVFPVGPLVCAMLMASMVMLTGTDALGQSKGIFGQAKPQADESKTEVTKAAAKVSAPSSVDQSGRPKYEFLRQDEDWLNFTGQGSDDPFDSIKHIPLSSDPSIWASIGGHFRIRSESWSRFNFATTANHNDTFYLLRLLLHGDLHFGKNLRFFVEAKTAGSTMRDLPGGHRTLDVDTLDLQQAFFDVTLPLENDESLTIRTGRQALLFGKQRLVSPLPWGNTLRSWDGVTAILNTANGWKISSFYTQFAPVQKYEFNDADKQTQFSGVYATNAAAGLDLYWLFLDKQTAVTFNGTTGNEDRHTLGGRIWGQLGDSGIDYEIEGAYQTGEVGTADVDAFMFASEIGFKLAGFDGDPRWHIGFDYASGDRIAGDNKVQAFNHLFPLGHAYFGYIDTVGRQNIIDLSTGLTLKPIDKLVMKITGHVFWRAEDEDAFYNAGGGVVRAGAAGTSSDVGSELDILLKYPFTRHLVGTFGYSHFFADTFLEQTGAHRDIDFVYLSMQYTF